ncbi:4Fe-4S ferredoxin [bacterium]|nr:4Fe-4S ferredoxin [bacterium]
MAKTLYIDLEKCRDCKSCHAECSYFYHPFNDGITYLREVAEFTLTCRQCEAAPCIEVCPTDALERQDDGIIRRWNIRCVACNSCSYACPFGTILPELIGYAVSRCDFCHARLNHKDAPVCVDKCTLGAISYGEYEVNEEKNIYRISDHLLVHAISWNKKVLF